MKTYITLAILSIFILTGCSSTKSTGEYDDVYYNPTKVEKQTEVAEIPVVIPAAAVIAEPIVQEQVYAEMQSYPDENLTDYEVYKLQREAEMLGESYEPAGSEAVYADQYQDFDSEECWQRILKDAPADAEISDGGYWRRP